uniref:Tumor necrosis factor receptor superfamily member 4-like n=1 Tax=Hippocampus comes TaxID=109280 RepID=A0A3Q3D1L5_HIPCM
VFALSVFFCLFVCLFVCKLIKMHGGSQKYCAACPEGYHQPTKNYSKQCKACTKCNEESGSEVTEKCTKKTDTKCQCRKGFVPVEPDSATCECGIGFGLHYGGKECSKCEDGFFNRHPNSPCIKWKECKSGVNTRGSSTSDVICNADSHNSPTSNHTVSVITPQHEWDQSHDSTQHETTTTITTTPTPPSNSTMTFLVLIVHFFFRYCLCHPWNSCIKTISLFWLFLSGDSLYRRPVEEIGDGTDCNLNSKKP